jgi:hypothetical protein
MEFWIGNNQWNVNGFFIGIVKLFHQTVWERACLPLLAKKKSSSCPAAQLNPELPRLGGFGHRPACEGAHKS